MTAPTFRVTMRIYFFKGYVSCHEACSLAPWFLRDLFVISSFVGTFWGNETLYVDFFHPLLPCHAHIRLVIQRKFKYPVKPSPG